MPTPNCWLWRTVWGDLPIHDHTTVDDLLEQIGEHEPTVQAMGVYARRLREPKRTSSATPLLDAIERAFYGPNQERPLEVDDRHAFHLERLGLQLARHVAGDDLGLTHLAVLSAATPYLHTSGRERLAALVAALDPRAHAEHAAVQ